MKKKAGLSCLLLATALLSLSAVPLRSVTEGMFESRSNGTSLWGIRNSFILSPQERPPFFLTPGITVYPDTALPELEGGLYVVWADRSYSRLAYRVAFPFRRDSRDFNSPEHRVSFDLTQETARQILILGGSSFINSDRFTASLYLASRWTGETSRFGLRTTGWVTSTEGLGASAAADWDLFTEKPLGWNLGFTAGTYRREDQTELIGAALSGRTALVIPLARGRVVYQISLDGNPDYWAHRHSLILDLSL